MPDWWRVTVSGSSAVQGALLSEQLVALGASAIEDSGGTLVTYLPATPDSDLAAVEACVAPLLAGSNGRAHIERVPDQDWLTRWRDGLAPRRVGARLIVAPSWTEPDASAGDLVIRIDPQMAFGTGEHATTRGVLRLLQQVNVAGATVLDVGTGSAVLAIAAAKLGAADVRAVESDADAIDNAAANIGANGVAERTHLEHALVDSRFLAGLGPAALDGILANVLSGVLVPLLPAFRAALRPHGWLILSGILATEAAAVVAAAAAAGFLLRAEDRESEWWSGLLHLRAATQQ